MANTITCMLTTVKNTSGSLLDLNFWPPHGNVSLADGAEISVYGDIYAALTRGNKPRRNIDTFNALLLDGSLEIVKTPALIVYDPTADRTFMISVDNETIYAVDPCWADTEYSSAL
jgi:hypothetical protein